MYIIKRKFKCLSWIWPRHSWNIHFFTSLDEIKVIFTPNIWISSIYCSIVVFCGFYLSSWSLCRVIENCVLWCMLVCNLYAAHRGLYRTRHAITFWQRRPRSACPCAVWSGPSLSANRHYENKPIQIYWKFYHQKNEILFFFYISAQNIDCGYSLEPPRRGGSNEYP